MRIFFVVLFVLVSYTSRSQSMSQRCADALEHIYRGYIQYGVDELKKISSANSLEAQYFMAICYENGIGVQQSNIEAFKYIRKSAERGLPDAMHKLAMYYQSGFVVTADQKYANEWLKRYEAKGGKSLLPDMYAIINEGLKHSENYALAPGMASETNGNAGKDLAMQSQGNSNSNNSIVNNSQVINNITIVQAQNQPENHTSITPTQQTTKSDVDMNIPVTTNKCENTFALIIANENYQDLAKVQNALNDGDVFCDYCKNTLGIPESNVTLIKDATFNNIKREINRLSQIANAYSGKAKIIFYYAGHGVPNESTKNAYLLPVDGYITDTSTGYSLNELYSTLGKMPAEQVVVLLDACFSGSQRGEGMLASARGVAIKPKQNSVDGKLVILSASQGDETAYPYKEEGHGLFTYYLLKRLKESQGNVSLGELAAYIKENVSKKSIVVNGKPQTPNVNSSVSLGESWKNWKLY